jgi:DNA repair protein RadA/Sms
MAKSKKTFNCTSCSYNSAKWIGKCPECEQWNTFEEETQLTNSSQKNRQKISRRTKTPKCISEINEVKHVRDYSGIDEFDRVVGGGLVPGSLVLIGGQPGIGKSTLLMEVMGRFANKYVNEKILYVSGEESESQVADRARRIGLNSENILIINESNWENIIDHINEEKPKYFVLDSIQTTSSHNIQSSPGSASQVKEVCYELMNIAKSKSITSMIIGHITKEGNIAGPKILEHMVDTVIYFDGDENSQYRVLRAIKNRFGNTNEIGIFKMTESGLTESMNTSQCFIEDHLEDAFGRSFTCIAEGNRPLIIEIQALVVENTIGNGKRTSHGPDQNRLLMMIAVMEKYLNISLNFYDVYINIVGGIKINTRDSDLSIIGSLLSSYKNRTIKNETIFLGEVGLSGEIRSMSFPEMRLKEISKLSYKTVFTSDKVAKKYQKDFSIELIGLKKIEELLVYFN